MTFFLVRDFLEAAFPVQQGGLLWLFAVGRGQRVQSCVVVKLLGCLLLLWFGFLFLNFFLSFLEKQNFLHLYSPHPREVLPAGACARSGAEWGVQGALCGDTALAPGMGMGDGSDRARAGLSPTVRGFSFPALLPDEGAAGRRDLQPWQYSGLFLPEPAKAVGARGARRASSS